MLRDYGRLPYLCSAFALVVRQVRWHEDRPREGRPLDQDFVGFIFPLVVVL